MQAVLLYMASYSPYEQLLQASSSKDTTAADGPGSPCSAHASPPPPHVGAALAHARWPVLLTAGLHDMRVPYWGPAKYAALLRSMRAAAGADADSEGVHSKVLLTVHMGAGHFASSGAADRLGERASKYAFLAAALALL